MGEERRGEEEQSRAEQSRVNRITLSCNETACQGHFTYVFKPWYDWKCRSWFQFLSVAILCCLPSLSSRVSIFDLLILDRLLLDISRFLLLLPSLLPLPRPAANARLFHLHDSLRTSLSSTSPASQLLST
uniref:Uncharacterized protein n=1 Tax=Guillardia theta TaxID=55529 RepID=A0A6U5Z8C9_GUITH